MIFPNMKRKVKYSLAWLTFLLVVCAALIGIWWRLGLNQTNEIIIPKWRLLLNKSNKTQSAVNLSSAALLQAINQRRQEKQLTPLKNNSVLQKLANLSALEIEDQNSLQAPLNLNDWLAGYSTTQPPNLEFFSALVDSQSSVQQILSDAEHNPNQESPTDQPFWLTNKIANLAVTTREAQLNNQSGILIVMIGSADFSDPNAKTTQTAQSSSTEANKTVEVNSSESTSTNFTGQDLWQAVQNYRQAHQLFAFVQANELCTVASIRLNEQIELGKLDNHDGFDNRAEQFFADHPEWIALNENLAAGYQNAVQTVEWGWDNSLGHQALIKSQDYPYACTAAGYGFAVLITGNKK